MAAIIRIKRSTGTAAPSSLKFGELAYTTGAATVIPYDSSDKGDRLFIGSGTEDSNGNASSIDVIGGKYFADLLDHQPGVLAPTSAIITDDQSKIDRLLVNNTVIDSNGVSTTNPTLILAGDTNISVDSQQIKNLADPTLNQDAATKYYVDSHIGAVTIDLVTDSGSRHVLNLVDSDLTILGNSPIKTQIDRHQIYISLDSSGVTAGSYGSQTQIPVFSVDSHGLIDSASTVNVATELTVKADSGSDLSISLIDSSLSIVGGTNIGSIIGDSNTVTLNLDSNVLGLASLTVDNIKIDGNEISTTDSSGILYLNPWPSNDSGEVIIRGSLRVDGTTTTFNSTTLTVNDKNIVLADSAVDSTAADGAGITVAGANATFTYDASGDKWIFNKAPHYNDERLLTNTDSAYLKSVIDSDYMDSLLSDNYLDSAEAQSIIDSNFQNLSQSIIPDSDEAYDLGSPTKKFKDLYLSGTTLTIGNISISDSSGQISFRDSDGNVVSISTLEPQIIAIVDSSYVNARLDTLSFLDSAEAVSLIDSHVDSAYVNARLDTSLFLDSSEVILLVDSNYVNARLDTSLFLDSGEAIQLIDSSHVQARQITYNTSDFLDSSTVELVVDSDYVNARLDTSSFLDSSEAIQLVDSAYVQARQITYNTSDFLDSSSVTLVVDSDYVNARVNLTNSLDSAEAIALIDSAYVQARQITYNTSNFTDSAFVTGLPVSTFDNDRKYLDSTSGQELFDSDYIQYRARAGMVAGTGVTYDSHTGVISIGQNVGTTDDVTFGKITGDSAVVGEVAFNTSFHDSHIPFQEGALWYDPHHKNLNYYTDFDHPIEIGMQVIERVYNNNAYTILKGQPLYYSGNRTNEAGQESPTVGLANATESTKYNVQGLSAEDIAPNSYGQIVVAGVIDGFDTSSLTAGLNFFAGLTDGAVQNAPPTYPNYPMCLGWVIKSDSSEGKVIINQQNHSVNSFRVQGDTHISSDLRVDGDLIVVGTQTITSTENVQIGGNIQYLNAGDTIGEAGTSFVGTGLDDAFYSGHYSGDSSSKSFFVKIDATGTPDTFEWGFDSSVGTEATGVAITGAAQLLDSAYGISIDFGATTGHTVGDKWTGTAAATDIDTGFFSNRNTGDAGDGYTHLGLYYDVTENEWTFVSEYEPEPDAPIDRADASFAYGDVRGKDFYGTNFNGNLTGNVTGTVSDISNHSTTDLSEGNNLYYTTARHDSDTLAQVDSAYVQSRQVTYNTSDFLDSTSVTLVVDSAYVQARQLNFDSLLDSAEVIDLVDSAYVQLRQITYNTSNFTDSAYVTGLPISTFDNDRKYFDSNSATAFVDASYVQARQITYNTSDFLDSSSVSLVVDGAYVQARQITYNTSDFTDSAFVTGLPISTFDNDRKYLDSNAVTNFVDASYVQSRQTSYNTSDFTDSAFVTGLPISTFDNDRKYLDSNAATAFIDASYVQSRQITYNTSDFLDSSSVTLVVDAAYVQARQITYNTADFTDSAFVTGLPISTFDNDRKYLDSNAATVFTTDLIDSAYITARAGAGTDSAAVIALIDSDYINSRSTGLQLISDSGDLSWQRVYSFATTDPVNGSLAIQHKIVLFDSVGTEKFANVPTVGTLTDSIGDIGNVNVTGDNAPTDGQTLVWDNANSYWKPGAGGGLDSALATQLIDATYINSLGLPVSTFDNDRKYLDSNSAGTFIDSDYVLGKMGMTGDANGNLTLINNRDITTGALTVADSGTPVSINSTNSTTSKIEFQDNGTTRGYLGASTSSVLDIGDSAASTLVSVDVGGNVLPAANGTQDLGSSSLRWQNMYTSDLNLSNGIGDYTVVEGEEDLFLHNNKTGKVFKFALIEVDPSESPPKIENLRRK